jgi:putative FmdB family regulatory protein
MPIYQYRCKACEYEFEIRQRMADDPLTHCPVCQGEIRRIVNSVGVVFKGKGFYVTDNRSGGSAVSAAAKGDKDKSEKSDAGDSSASGDKSEKGEKKAAGESKESSADKSPAPVSSPAKST